jgi:hypothetical protein
VTKKKVELTTTRQIATRVQRQLVLEDGKVVEDSGPIVSTNTTEDTEKQEHKHTEVRYIFFFLSVTHCVQVRAFYIRLPQTMEMQI